MLGTMLGRNSSKKKKKIIKISQDLIKSGNDAAPAPTPGGDDDFFLFWNRSKI